MLSMLSSVTLQPRTCCFNEIDLGPAGIFPRRFPASGPFADIRPGFRRSRRGSWGQKSGSAAEAEIGQEVCP